MNAETDVWLFQSKDLNEIDYLEDSKEALFDFLFNNLESYFNFYINVEKSDIKPSGIADIWFSFKVSDKSKKLIIDTLNKIKDSINDLSELSDIRDVMDTRLPSYYYNFLDNIEVISIEVIKTN